MKKVRKAVIPVAGYGTRLLPYTKAVPKPMLPVVNVPAIQLIAKEASDAGIEEIMFVVGHKKEIIESHFSPFIELEKVLLDKNKTEFYNAIKFPETMAKITFAVQENQRGTADAIAVAKDFVKDEPFAVLFGDDLIYNEDKPVIKQLMEAYDKTGKTIIGVKTVPHEDVPKYASVEYDTKDGRLYHMTKIVEKPPIEEVKSDISPLGRYVLAPTVMDIIETLEPDPRTGEYCITSAFEIDSQKNGVYAYEFEGTRYDLGDRLGFLKANVEYGLRDKDLHDGFKEYILELAKKL
ncbi:MAG: UTP--glucose-1-phosphate uridylyltransferase [Clostridia bacterium]|nr:UTP--glucose-1-phosphate uridylyltransferase [Clostridia bacterium]